MKGADIGVGWVDGQGQVHFQVRYIVLSFTYLVDTYF